VTKFGHCDNGDSYFNVTATFNGDWSPFVLSDKYLSNSVIIIEYYIGLIRVASNMVL
jgi:hypothetical protein